MALAMLLQEVVKKGELKMLCGQTFKMLNLQKWLNSVEKSFAQKGRGFFYVI